MAKEKKKMKVYISGPMSGLKKEEYQQKFRMAEHYLREKGYETVNPSSDEYYKEHDLDGKDYADILLEDLAVLRTCDAIYMLANWEQSNGAQVEYRFARNTGMGILDF